MKKHDQEILINTILDTKNKEIEEIKAIIQEEISKADKYQIEPLQRIMIKINKII